MTRFFAFACSLLLVCQLHAQRGWEVGGWAGVSYYLGDLNTRYDLSKPGLAGGAIFRYNLDNRICFKLGLNAGKVSADDKDSDNNFEKLRNLNFRTNILEGELSAEFNFLPYNHGSRDEFFTPFIFAGVGLLSYKPQAGVDTDDDGKYDEWVDLQPLGTEGQFQGEEYYTVQPMLTYGFGMKVDLTQSWSVNTFISSRFLFTDYLDDVSKVYPDMGDLENLRGIKAVQFSDRSAEVNNGVSIGEFGRQRGDSHNNDMYAFIGIGIVYYFGGIKCPRP